MPHTYRSSASTALHAAHLPQRVDTRSTATVVAAGETHTAALLDSGAILTWGSNDAGQLGHRLYTDDIQEQHSYAATGLPATALPQFVHFPKSMFGRTPLIFVEVSCGMLD